MRKVYDSDRRTWQAEGEKDAVSKYADSDYLNIEVVYPFSVNEVKFNSGLNEDFRNALEQGQSGFEKL